MKKSIVFILSALILLGASVNANAQHFIVKGGVSYSNAPKSKDDFRGYTGWMAGIGYQVGNFAGFSIQPELLYKVKGVDITDAGKIKMNYLEIPVNVQFGPDLLIARPYVIAAPFIGFNLANSLSREDVTLENIKKTIEKVEYGFGLGAGLDVWKLQLAFKYNWNFGHVVDVSDYYNNVKNIEAAKGGFELTIGLKF